MSTKWIPSKAIEGDPTGDNKKAYGKVYQAKVARSAKNEKAGKYKVDTYRNDK